MVTVVTKTIGPTGRDYATFTLAEAAVESIATAEFGSTDLVANDGAIVFEADAATYSESVNFSSSLTTDATRQVTYKPAAGSEHSGDPSSGVIVGTGIDSVAANDIFTRLHGLHCYGRQRLNASGSIASSLIISSNNNFGGEINGANQAVAPTYENCLFLANNGQISFQLFCGGNSGSVKLINCTFINKAGQTTGRGITLYAGSGVTATASIVNSLGLTASHVYNESGSTSVSGSNNFGGSTNPFPAAIQGSPYPITATTSFSTPLGSGDYAVYMGATGALADVTGNDVWQQGVGPGTNSDVPTTDINGVARSGASCNPGAFEADGFVAPTVITRTIDASGAGDYTTFNLALADLANVAGGSDLTLLNRAVAFEAVAGNYAENVNVDGASFDFDPTRNLTLRPQVGSEHRGDRAAGVIVAGGTSYAFRTPCDFLRLEGLVCTFTGNYGVLLLGNYLGVLVDGLIVDDLNNATMAIRNDGAGATADFPVVIQNCVVFVQGSRGIAFFGSGTYHARVTNCTVVHSAIEWCYINYNPSATLEFTNNIALTSGNTFRDNSGTATITGSNNFGGSSAPWAAALQGSPYPITASTAYDPGAGDFALYVSSTGQLLDSPHNDVIGGGVGPAANADVPTTDIVGRVRTGGTTNPGAFAVAQATRVVTKTIGPSGRDYATFTLAEAAVESIATAETGSTDLVAGNARIEVLADAGTYVEGVNVTSALTTDATRQVTYKPAAGSEHGGDFSAGVRVVFNTAGNGCFNIDDDFTHIVGLVCTTDTGAVGNRGLIQADATGLLVEGCILQVEHSTPWCLFSNQGGSTAANVYQNNVLRNANQRPISLYSIAAPTSHKFINNTIEGHGDRAIFYQVLGNSMTVEAVNNFIFNVNNWAQGNSSGGATFTTTGSNNVIDVVGSNMGAGVVVLVCTATTNTDPGPGHFAIYDADTGALVNVAANTVWQRGVGPSVNSDVPTTGIAGFTRSGATANPGAFAASTSLAQTTNPVARFFTYKRPSSQLFNHHRRVTCVFPDDGPSGNGNTFAVGVAARGFISPVSRDCVAFFVYYTTDGAGGQTSLRLEVARIVGQYSQDAIAEAQPIAVVEKQAVGEAIPAGFDFPGQSHTVAFKVQTFSGATTPESAAEYTAYIDGTAVTFDTFYQSATQDGTTKVVTHPAPAVGTTQGRAEAFFWYATADRTDSLGSANYALPQWSDWNQLAVDPDPIFDGEGQSITVEGEGTGTVNFSTALEHVDFAISVQYEFPRFDTPFASGHRYTSPRFENSRRVITASATNIDKATMDLIVQFHAARKGIEEPFLFNFPIPDTTTSETYTVITVQFADTAGMVYRRDAENIYSVQLNMIELL